MYTDKGLRYLGLALAAVGAGGLVLCFIGLFDPGFALTRGPWLGGAIGFLVLVVVMGGDTVLTWSEKQANIRRTATINDERELRNRERARRLAPPTRPTETTGHLDLDWRTAAHRFLWWGDRYGFTIRELATEQDAVSWDDWGLMRDYLIEAGILGGTGIGTRWADGWSWERWERERHTAPLPHRPTAAPEVAIPVNTTTPQQPQQATEAVGG